MADLVTGLLDAFDEAVFKSVGSGGRAFWQFALQAVAAQVEPPIIGQYLGYYFAGHEDLSELTYVPSGNADKRDHSTRGTFGDNENYLYDKLDLRKELGVDGYANQSDLANPSLLADASPGRSLSGQLPLTDAEMSRALGDFYSSQASGDYRGMRDGGIYDAELSMEPPRRERMREVTVHGVRPDRNPPPATPLPPTPVGVPPSHYGRHSSPPATRPEVHAVPREEKAAQPIQTAAEVIISTADLLPFDLPESDPDALARAEGMGHIEWGDLVALARGGYNGLIGATQEVARLSTMVVGGPLYAPLIEPYAESVIGEADRYRLSIDPRYGGGGIIGEGLLENLALEALPLAPRLPKGIGRAGRAAKGFATESKFMTELRALLNDTRGSMGSNWPAKGVGGGRSGRPVLRAAAGRNPAAARQAASALVTNAAPSKAELVAQAKEGLRETLERRGALDDLVLSRGTLSKKESAAAKVFLENIRSGATPTEAGIAAHDALGAQPHGADLIVGNAAQREYKFHFTLAGYDQLVTASAQTIAETIRHQRAARGLVQIRLATVHIYVDLRTGEVVKLLQRF